MTRTNPYSIEKPAPIPFRFLSAPSRLSYSHLNNNHPPSPHSPPHAHTSARGFFLVSCGALLSKKKYAKEDAASASLLLSNLEML
jgi:hypothetical protein